MKKSISIILAFSIILSLFVFPAVAETDSKLVYKSDFTDTCPSYTTQVKNYNIEGINYNFSILNYGSNGNGNVAIDYVDFGGKKAMRIRANGDKANVAVTPLKADGSPIVLEEGKTYTVKATIIPVRVVINDYQRFLTEAYVRQDGKSDNSTPYTNYASVAENKWYVPGAIKQRSAAVYTDGVKAYYMLCDSTNTQNMLASHAALYTSNAVAFSSVNSVGLNAQTVYDNQGAEITTVTYGYKSGGGNTFNINQTVNTLCLSESAADDTENDFDDLNDWGITKTADGLYKYNIESTEVTYTNHLAISVPGTNANGYIKVENGVEPIDTPITVGTEQYCKIYNEYYITDIEVYVEEEAEEEEPPVDDYVSEDEVDTNVYYKFDFSAQCPAYTSSVTETYTGLGGYYASVNQSSSATTVVDYVEYNGKYAMRIRTNGGSGNIVVTPRKNDAENTPIKLKSGNNYIVNYNLVVSRYGTSGTARLLSEPYVISNGTIETNAPYPNPSISESEWYKPGTQSGVTGSKSRVYRSAAWYLGAPYINETAKTPTVYYIQADPANAGIVASYAGLYVAPMIKQVSGYTAFGLDLQKVYNNNGAEVTSTLGYSADLKSGNSMVVKQKVNALPRSEAPSNDTENDFDDLNDWNVLSENGYYKYKKNGSTDSYYTDHFGISLPAWDNTTQYIKVEGDVEPLNDSQVITVGGVKYCLAYNEYFITDLSVTGGDIITCEIDYNGGHPYKIATEAPATKEFYKHSIFETMSAHRDGCKFLGWYLDKEMTVTAEGKPVEENNKYYAKWLMYGDCDSDFIVDTTDLAKMKLFLAGAGDVDAGADCDDSDGIDTTDLAKLKLYLANAGSLGPKSDDWRTHPEDYKLLAFTFDDVPSYTTAINNNTRTIIDAFVKYDGKATLFVTGTGIRQRGKELVEYGLSQGFELGNHTSTHADLTDLSREETLKEITDLNDLVKEEFGYDLKWLRTGGISYNEYLWDIMTELNMPAFRGGCPIYDYKETCTADEVKGIVLDYAKDGMIYLMHGFSSASAGCLEETLGILYEQGYRFVTISEYFEMRGITDITTTRFITDLSQVAD